MTHVSPGVYVREIDLSLYIPQLSTTICAMVITATKGPVNTPTFISNVNQFILTFGQPNPNHLGTYSATQYLRRGQQLWIVRAASSSAAASSATFTPVKLARVASTVAAGTSFTISGTSNKLKVSVVDGRVTTAGTYVAEVTLDNGTYTPEAMAAHLTDKFVRNSVLNKYVAATTLGAAGAEVLNLVGLQPDPLVTLDVLAASADDAATALGFFAQIAAAPVTPTVATNTFQIKARSAGTWGDSLTVQFTLNPKNPFTFDLGVYQSSPSFKKLSDGTYAGLRVELHQGLSMLDILPSTKTNPNWIGTALGTVNTSLDITELSETGRSAVIAYEVSSDDALLTEGGTALKLVVPKIEYKTLSGGDDGLTGLTDADFIGITTGVVQTGLQAFRNPETIDINLLLVPGVTSPSVINEMLVICEERGDCMAIIDVPDNYSVQQAVDWHNGQGAFSDHQSFSSSYGAMYYGWLKVYDAYNAVEVWTPPSGHAAGVYAYTDFIAETWFAPAGFNRAHLVQALDVRYSPQQGERDFMYGNQNALNPVVKFPKDGITIWGQRTLQRAPTALDRINVRRLLLYMRKVVATAVKYLTFEPNDEFTWRQFNLLVDPFCQQVKSRRGIYDFAVICDHTTNTPDLIDQNIMTGRIYLKPTKTAEIINVDFVLTSTGARFEDVLI